MWCQKRGITGDCTKFKKGIYRNRGIFCVASRALGSPVAAAAIRFCRLFLMD